MYDPCGSVQNIHPLLFKKNIFFVKSHPHNTHPDQPPPASLAVLHTSSLLYPSMPSKHFQTTQACPPTFSHPLTQHNARIFPPIAIDFFTLPVILPKNPLFFLFLQCSVSAGDGETFAHLLLFPQSIIPLSFDAKVRLRTSC